MHEAGLPDYRHEDMSIRMFEHLLDANGLREKLLEVAGMTEEDFLFVKELIAGPIDPETGRTAKTKPKDGVWPFRGMKTVIHCYTQGLYL